MVLTRALTRTRHAQRGLTLVELLIVIALIAVLGGTVLMGPGLLEGSRLKSASTLIVSSVRLGLARASTTGRPTRLAFDLDNGKVTLEEANSSVVLREHTKDSTSGAAPATDLEKAASAESERILSGPHAPRPTFKAVPGFSSDQSGPARSLGNGVEFISVQTEHDDDPRTNGRAYLYFFPGGTTERASVQLKRRGDDSGLTVMISGLTGRAKIERGRVDLPAPRSDGEASERSEQ